MFADLPFAVGTTMTLRLSTIAAAALGTCGAAVQAQTATDATTLPGVTVTARAESALSVAGWGDVPPARLPLQASVIDEATLRTFDIQRLADLTRLDPAVNDAYNAVGYWDASGDADWNIAIRTVTVGRGAASFHAGGAIVADSTPEGEYEETLVKASGMMRALGVRRAG